MKGTFLVLLSFLALSANVAAENCYEKSPGFILLEDSYYKTEVKRKTSEEENDKLKEFYSNISGDWKGSVVFLDCKGSDKAPRRKIKNANATMEIPNQDKLKITAKFYYNDSDNLTKRRYKLLRNNRILNFKFITPYHLKYTELVRIKNKGKGKGNRLVENIYTINLKNEDILNFSILYYVNGVFVGDEKWAMVRDY